jgi:ribosomal protein S18 acetylase RimI-like enzyme
MRQLTLEQRRLLGPRAPFHVGDIAWGLNTHEGREDEWDFRLWRDHDRVVAWSWLDRANGLLEVDVRPDRRDVLDEVLAEPAAHTASSFEDDGELREILARHGFTKPGGPMDFLVRDLDATPPVAPLPEGFRCRTVEEADLAERVAAHRDAFAPSRVTEKSYRNVMSAWPYRRSLDCVVEAPDGRFAAYCLIWPDDENRVGELEPVGTRSEFRRRGLGAAVCTFALRRLYEEGGRQAVVYCFPGRGCDLYRSIGFEVHASMVGYSR